MSPPVVVVGCPIHACKAYAAVPYLRGLARLREATSSFRVEIVLADNTEGDEGRFARDLPLIDRRCHVLRPEWDRTLPLQVNERIRASSEAIRVLALEAGAVGWLSVEADVLPDPTALEKLVAYADQHDLQAVQGFYYAGFTAQRFAQDPYWLMGLSFIRDSVLQEIPFRIDLQRPNGCPDAFYGHDMMARGIRYGFHPAVAARHLEATRPGRGWEAVNADLARARRYTEWLLGEAREAGG